MDATDLELEAIHQTIHRLEQRWNVLPIPDANVYFAYDPLPLSLFLPGVRAAAEATEGRSFLDLGCGVGTKLALMYALGWDVAGVDRHEPYVAAARELVPEADVAHAEIQSLDRFDADLVYAYRPMVSDDDQAALERHIVEGMRPGAILFLPVRLIHGGPLGLEPIARSVWRKR